MTLTFRKFLLSELRMVVYQPGDPAELTDELLCEAVTVNENLASLGFCLKPEDIIKLAVSPSIDTFYEEVEELVPDIKGEPLFPGFPQEVMEMSEATFQFCQAVHYFSTYGVEMLLGERVDKGWLPGRIHGGPGQIKKGKRLMETKVIDLVPEEEAAIQVLTILFGRRERLTYPEMTLVLECAAVCTAEQMQGLKVRFKENLDILFPRLMYYPNRDVALKTLRVICAHTGDVLRCSMDYIRSHRYHLTTSEKKLLVKLLESYPLWNLRQNLIQSQRLRERNLLVLQHLDYNRFSRSPEHKEAVRALRNDELLSWHGIGEKLLKKHSPKALTHLAQRPGYMVRMLNRLQALGYTQEEILEAMRPRADAVSGHLVLRVLRSLASREAKITEKYHLDVADCERKYREQADWYSPQEVRWRHEWEITCIKSRAQQEIEYMVKWDYDKPMKRAHRTAELWIRSFKKELVCEEEKLLELQEILKKQERCQKDDRFLLSQNAHTEFDEHILMFRFYPDYFREAAAEQEMVVRQTREKFEQEQAAANTWLREELRAIRDRFVRKYDDELLELERREAEDLAKEELLYRFQQIEAEEILRTIPQRKAAELAALEKAYQEELLLCKYDADSAKILKELLKAHFALADTPLKGKRVFCKLNHFDLAHSSLETEDRSKDGGYIRSGISYKIPPNANIVRLFIYWNDPNKRVDVDLHAAGLDVDGNALYVGWTGDFRKNGVLYSGDVTHSNAAEYIDIDLNAPIKEISANVSLAFGKYSFKGIQTCFVGMMAVNEANQEVKLYSPKNCFFTHELNQNLSNMHFGYVDVQNRYVRFVGQENTRSWESRALVEHIESMFSMQDYLDCLLEGQGVTVVKDKHKADVILTMEKNMLDNGICLVDNNFFLEC